MITVTTMSKFEKAGGNVFKKGGNIPGGNPPGGSFLDTGQECVRPNHKPQYGFVYKPCRIRGCKYYGITLTIFGTVNLIRVDFPSSAYFSFPGK